MVIAFSMVFTAFTPIVSYADEVIGNDTIINGEKPLEGQTPEGKTIRRSDSRRRKTIRRSDSRRRKTVRRSDSEGEKTIRRSDSRRRKPLEGQTPKGKTIRRSDSEGENH